ncbi:hypothetical protein GBA52_003839 [Prunus armeniaca]|nr:hypothetical protein GBA52_003839 [Prunus armeniaca]
MLQHLVSLRQYYPKKARLKEKPAELESSLSYCQEERALLRLVGGGWRPATGGKMAAVAGPKLAVTGRNMAAVAGRQVLASCDWWEDGGGGWPETGGDWQEYGCCGWPGRDQ